MPGIFQDMESTSDELDLATFRTNIEGSYFVTKRALPLIFKSPDQAFEKSVIFVSSMAGWLENPEIGVGMVPVSNT